MTLFIKSSSFESDFNFLLKQNGFQGEVRGDPVTKILYSTDASIYQVEPKLVVFPKVLDDLDAIVTSASIAKLPITPRGSGSGLAGQAIGESIIIDCSKYLNQIERIDPLENTAVVQPGVILANLNKKSSVHNLQFGPDPASAERATLGGSIANNASGAHSIVYGLTSDHIQELEVVLSDGNVSIFNEVDLTKAVEFAKNPSVAGLLYKTALLIRSTYKQEIIKQWPHTWRRVSGYNLNYLVPWTPEIPPQWAKESILWGGETNPIPYPPISPDKINLAPLFAGSEGTLGIIKRATVRLVPKPVNTVLGVISYSSIEEACDDVPRLLRLDVSAIELIPQSLIELARSVPAYSHLSNFLTNLDPSGRIPEAILVVEICGDDTDRLIQRGKQLSSNVFIAAAKAAQNNIWALRKVGLGILMSRPGSFKPIAFIEDMAVPVEKLGDFVREMKLIMNEYGTSADYYAHASAGCLHIRPILNMKSDRGIKHLRSIAERAVDLALSIQGAVSAEHGDGYARSEWLERAYGKTILQAFRELKYAADPDGIMNPGKIVDPLPMDQNLRYNLDYKTSAWKPVFQTSQGLDLLAEESLIDSIEQCNGAGVCRKFDGVMCPSFQASTEEMHSTRGRANLLRAMISGKFSTPDLAQQSVREALDLCLACKGCKSECPSGVDIAKLKYEFMEFYYRQAGHRRPIRDYFFGYIATLARFGYFFRPVSNMILKSKVFKKISDQYLNLAYERDLPAYAPNSVSSTWQKMRLKNDWEKKETVIFLSDAFTEYFYPKAGMAALKLLSMTGCEIKYLPILGAGRTLISKGILQAARKHAANLVSKIRQIDPDSRMAVVGVEPSEIYTLREEYLEFFPDNQFVQKLARNSWMIEEFLIRPGNSGIPRINMIASSPKDFNKRVLLHGHCYQKAQPPCDDGFPVGVAATNEFLKKSGYASQIIEAGCCGMAGAFGYEKEHYQFSQKVGELALFPAIRNSIAEDGETILSASGVSCQTQIFDEFGIAVTHPAQLALMSFENGSDQK